MEYIPGLHILCEIKSANATKLATPEQWKPFMANTIEQFELQQVGEVVHQFEPAGFTAVHCLTESHIAIHTWPEYGVVTFDVFLCNYLRDNSALVQQVADAITDFFEGSIIKENKVRR